MSKFFPIFMLLMLPMLCFGQKDSLVMVQYRGIADTAKIHKIKIESNNRIWICTNDGIDIINNVEDPIEKKLAGQHITNIAFDNRHGIWATDGANLINIQTESKIGLPQTGLIINDLCFYRGRLWAATNNGVYVYNISVDKFEHLNTRNSKLPSKDVNFAFVDQKGILWLGTDSGEVRIDEEDWKTYHNGIPVRDYYENKEGIWFLSDDDMWLVDYFNREYKVGIDNKFYTGKINDFAIDSKGRLYFASDVLIRYDPYAEDIDQFTEDAGILTRSCSALACDKNDNFWIGSSGVGLFRLIFDDLRGSQLAAACIIEKPVSCASKADAALKVNVSGGKPPYNYAWSDNQLRGNNPKTVAAGEYTVTITDQIQNRYVTNVNVSAPRPLVINLVEMVKVSAPNKKDGSLKVRAAGGVGDLTYYWSNNKKGSNIDRIAFGNYTVTVTDANKCQEVASFEVGKEKFIPDLDISKIVVGKALRMNELNFTADSTEVSAESIEVLEEVYEFLAKNPSVIVEIGGHTNTIPPHEYCDKLSTDRAKNVANYFYNKGIDPNRVTYKGYGKRQPLTNSDSLEGRRRNQRVEIKILSI